MFSRTADNRKLKVAAYCRVFTDEEDQLNSLETRMKYYTGKISENSEWTFAGIYADEGISGTSVDKRKEFMRLMRDCQKGKVDYKTNPYAVENMAYNAERDEYTCPDGRKLKFKRESKKTTENGYTVSTRYYSNDKCGRCPHREKCHSSKNGYRTVSVNQILNEYRPKVLEALTSEEGTLLRMNRSIQVEGVFGVLKEDYGFRRFLTRGKKNVETQFFLLAFALNIEKLCNREKKGRMGLDLFPLNAS